MQINRTAEPSKNIEILEERDMTRTQAKKARDEQANLDEFAQTMSRLVVR